jgi:hypothetical protein
MFAVDQAAVVGHHRGERSELDLIAVVALVAEAR